MIDKHLLKLRARDVLSAPEEQVIRGLVSEVREVSARTTIIHAEQVLTTSTLLLEGWMYRYKDLTNGGRQITAVHIAGDFVDLHSFTLKQLDHSIMTATRCKYGVVPHSNLKVLSETEPHLSRLYWLTTNIDAAIHREWELSLGRRTAIGRLAHILCELRVRLELVGLADASGYDFPLTQQELSECTGLTPVHVNRMLRELRESGYVETRSGKVTVTNLPALEAIADFNPTYLNLHNEPR
jgi:CRP-like cAMP-binding protein